MKDKFTAETQRTRGKIKEKTFFDYNATCPACEKTYASGKTLAPKSNNRVSGSRLLDMVGRCWTRLF